MGWVVGVGGVTGLDWSLGSWVRKRLAKASIDFSLLWESRYFLTNQIMISITKSQIPPTTRSLVALANTPPPGCGVGVSIVTVGINSSTRVGVGKRPVT